MDQRKLRLGKPGYPGQQAVWVITIPPKIAIFYKDVYFNILHSGTSIILTSGAQLDLLEVNITNQDLENYKV